MWSSLACPHSSIALHWTMVQERNFRNSPHLQGYIPMRSLVVCRHSYLTLGSMPTQQLNPQQPTMPSGSHSDMHIGCLCSLFRSPPAAHQKIEPVICSRQTTTTRCSSVLQLLESDYIYAGMHYTLLRDQSEVVPAPGLLTLLRPLSLWVHLVFFFSALHILDRRTKCSSNCMVKSELRRHCILSLLPLRLPRHGHLL